MKPYQKISVAIFVLGFVAYAAYAETVTISTYYPSPYGSYQTLETNTLQGTLGGSINMVPTAGNIAIGTAAAPAAKLHVVGTSQNTLALDSPSYPELTFRQAGVIRSYDAIATTAGGYFGTSGVNDRIMRADAGNLLFGYQASEWMRVTTTGNVGIGTAAPATKLQVVGDTTLTGNLKMQSNTAANGANELQVDCSVANGNNCYALAVYA